ncbi:splicing factor ESS-2 homolog [Glossina fuscipes]|uniref:Splicing factor ESS-2 homolog n=1 Tax=Glossina fuscipes TaxID=7396 RepID=A0A9C5YXT2_9MUSC|nr:splicing factor ESS-2 homolog [Glossina fuscipes]KAI9582222.1 hypothetical protein GQX74_015345 [Glossina fuscipes]
MSNSNAPGSQALNKLKSRDIVTDQFKKPLPKPLECSLVARKKPKLKILTEDKYIEEMAKIIERDFFPDLERLRAQNKYLDAMERNDFAQMEAIRAKYSGKQPLIRSRQSTPATFETPASLSQQTPASAANLSIPSANDTLKNSKSNNKEETVTQFDKHSLDSFLQAYTSEDNYSFEEIMEIADQKLKQKFAILYNEEKISAEKLAKVLMLPSIEDQFEEDRSTLMRKIDTWAYKNKNSIMYIPDGVELTKEERIDMASRKQIVQHQATRLNENPFRDSSNDSNDILKNSARILTNIIDNEDGVKGDCLNSLTVKGFDLVQTPSPRPGEAFSPLMTWGEIEGTPFRLDGSDTPVRSNAGPSFKINETSRRENIALALAEKIGEKMRAQKQKAMDTARRNIASPFIRSNIERLASMSPAARRLATTKLGLRTPVVSTPSPLITSQKRCRSTNTSGAGQKLPTSLVAPLLSPSTSTVQKEINTEKSTLTDDLLQIPTKRLRAADFF